MRKEKLPDPWLFNSETLLERLEECRRKVMDIPICDLQSTHNGIKAALNYICNLQNDLRFLLHLHREGQRAFAKKAHPTKDAPKAKAKSRTEKREIRA